MKSGSDDFNVKNKNKQTKTKTQPKTLKEEKQVEKETNYILCAAVV